MPLCRTILLLACVATVAFAQTRPATKPAAWGPSLGGLQMRLQIGADGGLLAEVRSEDGRAQKPEAAFLWLLIVQDRDRAFFSDKVAWDAEIPAEGAAPKAIDLAHLRLFPHGKGLKIVEGYPTAEPPAAPAAAGVLADVVPNGSAKVRAQLYLPKLGAGTLLTSNAITVDQKTKWAELSDKAREAAVADLLKQLRRDEFGAKAAHDTAVTIGKDIVPQLLKAAEDPQMPAFGHMWLATALIDLNDDRATDRIIAYLSIPATRSVVAYHGPKLRNEKLDTAIMDLCEKGNDQQMIAWAARGFVTNHREFPDKLIQSAATSTNPGARAEVALAVAKRIEKHPKDADTLLKLIADEHQLVRVAAARATNEAHLKDDRYITALAAALDKGGGDAQSAILEALESLTGQKRSPAEWKTWKPAWRKP